MRSCIESEEVVQDFQDVAELLVLYADVCNMISASKLRVGEVRLLGVPSEESKALKDLQFLDDKRHEIGNELISLVHEKLMVYDRTCR